MHLKSISMKGFKSFPHRTKLDFSPGVGVVVGPNGSGKSNITDAVLWALGEQSPLAVRGQSMKDVIFAGGHGIKGSSSAEVEVVIDNGDGGLENTDFSEISILRRLGRDGEGEYRLNGARCRLADVVEVLSDTGLGKEMHSVVSQGRVEAIVLSKPRDRRMLIEEAAGLGKHRKRRRRAQLKLERTEENLSRALDVEREARSRLRPLKRQAEAAQLHERLQRQSDEARYELSRDQVREVRALLATAEAEAVAAKQVRAQADAELAEVAKRREAAEEALTALSREREELQGRLYAARSAQDRIGIRMERARDQAAAARDGAERRRSQLQLLEAELAEADTPGAGAASRVAALEQELAALEGAREERVQAELAQLDDDRRRAEAARAELAEAAELCREQLEAAERAAEEVRAERRDAERAAEAARSLAAPLRCRAGCREPVPARRRLGGPGGAAAVGLPGRRARLRDRAGRRAGPAAAGRGGGQPGAAAPRPWTRPATTAGWSSSTQRGVRHRRPLRRAVRRRPAAARPRDPLGRRRGRGGAAAGRRLGRRFARPACPTTFAGSAVTADGRVWRPASASCARPRSVGAERVLEQRNRRTELVSASERGGPRRGRGAGGGARRSTRAWPRPTPPASRPTARCARPPARCSPPPRPPGTRAG